MGNDATCTHNAIGTDRNTLAYYRAVADPDVVMKGDLAGVSDGLGSIVNIVPICIGKVSTCGNHRIRADLYMAGGVQTYAGAEQGVVTDIYAAFLFTLTPHSELHLSIPGGYHVHRATKADIRTVYLEIPRLHDRGFRTYRIEAWFDEVVYIGAFKKAVQTLGYVGAMVFTQSFLRVGDGGSLTLAYVPKDS